MQRKSRLRHDHVHEHVHVNVDVDVVVRVVVDGCSIVRAWKTFPQYQEFADLL
jgi:hypothetical protein